MATILDELDDIMRQKGYAPHVWDLRDDDVWVRHIASGGIDNPVYEFRRVGTVDETKQMLHAMPEWKRPVPGYCERCCSNSSNLNIHNCQFVFTIRAEEAHRKGEHTKVVEIIEAARKEGIELLGKGWENYPS